MRSKPTIWQRIGLHDWFLKKNPESAAVATPSVTPNDVFRYLLDKFNESIRQLSFADRVVFYHEYIIAFSVADYREFMEAKKGIFGLIVQESVKKFYEVLNQYKESGKHVEPSAGKWVFRFVSHPDYVPGDKGFIGKLLPGQTQKQENLRVTFIPRQTGIAQTSDISEEILKGFTFYSEGYYEVPFESGLAYKDGRVASKAGQGLARLETIVPDKAYAGKKIEYLMTDGEIIVTGSEDQRQASNLFRIPSEWVNTPHLRIRYSAEEDRFFLAAFGEKTLLNERLVERSSPTEPVWTELPVNSRLMLNGIVGINFFKS